MTIQIYVSRAGTYRQTYPGALDCVYKWTWTPIQKHVCDWRLSVAGSHPKWKQRNRLLNKSSSRMSIRCIKNRYRYQVFCGGYAYATASHIYHETLLYRCLFRSSDCLVSLNVGRDFIFRPISLPFQKSCAVCLHHVYHTPEHHLISIAPRQSALRC